MNEPATPSAYAPADVAEVYRRTFAARLDAYADWDDRDPDPARHHWTSVRHELTRERVLEGLRTPKPVSSYMEDAEGTTHVGAIDFDAADGWPLALRVAEVMATAGAFPMPERSRRGCHLWVVLTEPLPGSSVRLTLRWFVAQVSRAAASDPKVEILPKRLEQRGPTTVGSPLRMPMMAHPKTGERHPLCNAKGEPLGSSVTAALMLVRHTDSEMIAAIADKATIPACEAQVAHWMRRPAQEAGDVVALLVAAGVDRAAPGRSVRCPMHDDRVASLSIARDGERVFCKAPACEANNNERGLGADQLARALAAVHAA